VSCFGINHHQQRRRYAPVLRGALLAVLMLGAFLPASALAQKKRRRRIFHPAPVPAAVQAPAAATESPVVTAPVVVEPNPSSSPAAAPAPPHWPVWVDQLTIGGGAILYYYQPFGVPGVPPNMEVYFAYLQLDSTFDRYGLHIEPRFRDTRLRPFFDGPVWIEEAYGWLTAGPVTFQAGKIYSRLGLFWDNSFYGNIQAFDGLKVDPDYGLAVEGSLGDRAGLAFAAQYFLVDGRTNISLEGRDTISIPDARRRNIVIGRVDPFVTFASGAKVRVGLSAEHLSADLPDGAHGVTRFAIDAALTGWRAGLWAEMLRQYGETVTDFPYEGIPATATTPAVPGRFSTRNVYLLAGGQYTLGRLTVRYNFSQGDYVGVSVIERMHVPGLALTLTPNFTLLAEMVFWHRLAPEGTTLVDRSLNVTLTGHF
jgi:hypothetical protein